jgi:hypothetical protein
MWLVLLALAPTAHAQGNPQKGSSEIQLWTGGGVSKSGGARDISVWNAGFRYGYVLTDAWGPSFLRGHLEYAVDAMPIFWFFQPGRDAYGAGLNPINLKWISATGSAVVPYAEAGAGLVLTTRAAPPGAGRINFTSGGALGTYVMGQRRNIAIELRYMHISNAGLYTPNPGINTVQVRIGFGIFSGP